MLQLRGGLVSLADQPMGSKSCRETVFLQGHLPWKRYAPVLIHNIKSHLTTKPVAVKRDTSMKGGKFRSSSPENVGNHRKTGHARILES